MKSRPHLNGCTTKPRARSAAIKPSATVVLPAPLDGPATTNAWHTDLASISVSSVTLQTQSVLQRDGRAHQRIALLFVVVRIEDVVNCQQHRMLWTHFVRRTQISDAEGRIIDDR